MTINPNYRPLDYDGRTFVVKKQPGVPESDPDAAALAAGWNDFARDSLGPRSPKYETATKVAQMNYELGRTVAAAASVYLKPLPIWPFDRTYEDLRRSGLIPDTVNAVIVHEMQLFLKDIKKERSSGGT